jgi:cellulose synthase/poly-beta-1,6-N-acetylglucosamine synthase-like glycosyltransferase
MIIIIFWTSGFLIFYAYFGYFILSILLGAFFKIKRIKHEHYPRVSLIIPCYNEEKVIRDKLNNILALDYPKDKLQVLIASESNDATNSIVREYADSNIKLYEYDKRLGKTVILYNTVPHADGEILVFSDANVLLKNDCIKKIASNFYDESVGAVTGLLTISNVKASNISWGENNYRKYETVLRRSSGESGRVLNPDGAIFAIKKNLYSPINPQRGDDFELVIRVLLNNKYSVMEPEAVAYENASITPEAEINRKIRMVSWFLKSSMILLKEMALKFRLDLIFQLISHKILRWFTPYFFIILFISNCLIADKKTVYGLILFMQIVFYLITAISFFLCKTLKKNKVPVLLKLTNYFLIFNCGFLVGTIKGIFSLRNFPVWEKTR